MLISRSFVHRALVAPGLVLAGAACQPASSAKSPSSGQQSPMGGNGAVMLGATPTVAQTPPAPPLRVNQLGYLTKLPKHAVLATTAASPLTWELVDVHNKVLASGNTEARGPDADSGDKIHAIDFSTAQQPGKGYKLRVGSDESPAFDIGPDVYQKLKYDALAFFYQNRSGIEITAELAGDPKLARPAGHLSDKDVPCAPDAGCSYSLDVSGGWYDAGDHGKYVVNAGVSVWTLLNQWERMKHLAKESLPDFGDGKLRIPEKANKMPDLLDEVRWEVEWMLKMQVPAEKDKAKAGLVHHKMHDEKWTSLGAAPPSDTATVKMKRYLRPVSTAATLNLAAAAAQAARVYREYDAAFADKCLKAAELAWKAALANPSLSAPASDTIGGGPYDDKRVTDEFYWAASELYVTTRKPEYQQYIAKSPFYLSIPEGSDESGKGHVSAITWQSVAACGTVSLALVPNGLAKADVDKARQAITARADQYLKIAASQGYRVPFASVGGQYPWGSNSFILNNALVLGLASDFAKKPEYVNGVIDAMNYILGQNPMGTSYVSGYGTRSFQNPHHRFWAHQLNPDMFPLPPPGVVSGGPNSGLQDPVVNEAGLKGCKPQKCWLDNTNAYSVNEVTINWNAPLAWVAAFLDDKSKTAR